MLRPAPRRRRPSRTDRAPAAVAAAVALVAATALGGCADASTSSGACGDETSHALDPASLQHALAGTEVEHTTDPPTSGAHVMAPALSPVEDAPIDAAVQVGWLEQGGVLVQYGPDVAAADVADLADLATDRTSVAPNPGLGAEIVATAWRTSLRCDGVDLERLRRFQEAHETTGSQMTAG